MNSGYGLPACIEYADDRMMAQATPLGLADSFSESDRQTRKKENKTKLHGCIFDGASFAMPTRLFYSSQSPTWEG